MGRAGIMREGRRYVGLVIPIAFVVWRLWSLGLTSLETLRKQPTGAAAAHFKMSIMWEMWGAALALILIVIVIERVPLVSIGFRKPSSRDLAWVSIVAVVSVLLELVWALAFGWLSGYSQSTIPHGAPTSALPFAVRLLMFVTEPVFEETVFRGYLIEHIEWLTGITPLAVGISALGSSLMHGGWTLGLLILPFGLAAAILYAWRRNVPACLILHALWMLPALMVII
jgi:uncharacterized protein